MRRRKFTLIEMLVVICIIGILMSLFLVGVSHAVNAAKRTKFLGDVANVRAALEQYKNKNGAYPAATFALSYSYLNVPAIVSPWETAVNSAVDVNGDGYLDVTDGGDVNTEYPITQSAAGWTTDLKGKVIKSWE